MTNDTMGETAAGTTGGTTAGDMGHLGNAYGRFFTEIGTRADRPFKILAPMTTLSFGDVFIFASIAARVASAFDHSYCDFLVDHRRPYFKDILAFYPFAANVLVVQEEWSKLPFVALAGPARGLDWRHTDYHDLILTSGLLSAAHFEDLPQCALQIPQDHVAGLSDRLMRLGLRGDRWFCVMHWREPTYKFKAAPNPRDVDPQRYLPLIDHVIDDLGGQVVLLGHPEMTRPAPRDGLVDLAGIENTWVLQAFATSRARYFAGSPSGATGMAHAFLIPSAHLDVLDWYTGSPDDWALTPELRLPDGRYVRQDDLFQSGWMHSGRIAEAFAAGEAISMEKSSTVEMISTIDRIHRDTDAIVGWRPAQPPPLERANRIALPLQGTGRPRFIEMDKAP